jgi:hypothetical protein
MRGTGNLDDTPHQEGRQRVGEHAAAAIEHARAVDVLQRSRSVRC